MLQLIKPTSGSVKFEGQEIAGLSRRQMRPLRREMQMIFQDPYASLNPRKRVGQIVGDPLQAPGAWPRASDLRSRVQELLERVGLSSEHYNRFPHEFSGGQRQRIGIARALALQPKLVIADEPVSALDVSIQAQIINLLDDLQDDFGLTYLFVAHDIGVVRHISDRIAVMNDGKIVEQGSADEVCENPKDDYTKKLLAAVPIPDPSESGNGPRPRPAGPVSDRGLSLSGESSRSSPPAGRCSANDAAALAADQAAAGADAQRAAGGRGVGL